MKGWLLVVASLASVWGASSLWGPSGGWYFAYLGVLSVVVMEVAHRAKVKPWLKTVVISCELAAIVTCLMAAMDYSIGWPVTAPFYNHFEVYMYALAVIELVALSVYPFQGAIHGLYRSLVLCVGRFWAYLGDLICARLLGLEAAKGGASWC